MTTTKIDLRTLTIEAECAFWQVVAQHYPGATRGDLSIDRTVRLTMAAEAAIAEWIDNNVSQINR